MSTKQFTHEELKVAYKALQTNAFWRLFTAALKAQEDNALAVLGSMDALKVSPDSHLRVAGGAYSMIRTVRGLPAELLQQVKANEEVAEASGAQEDGENDNG